MNFFNNISIFKKVIAIFILAVIIFALNLSISVISINKNRTTLNYMEQQVYQRVELANQNVFFIQRLDELYTQSVSFADEDLLTNAGTMYESLRKNLQQLDNVDPSQANQLNNLSAKLTRYNDMTIKLAKGMLAGTIDMANIGQISQEKSQAYEAVLNEIQNYKQEKVLEFKQSIKEAGDRSEQSLWLTLSIGIALLIVMFIVTIAIARAISSSARNVAQSLSELADGKGDLSHKLNVSGSDELGQVSSNFNRFLGLLGDSIRRVVNVTDPLLASSHSLKLRMEDATHATQRQSHDASAVQVSMEDMRHSVIEISQNARQAASAAQIAEKEAMQGMTVVQRTIDISQELNTGIQAASNSINELARDTENVTSILNVITSIAEQTNLLALNAAIEAARAGEQGRGFAVVADEVRALASKTADATTEIRHVLQNLKTAAISSVSTMNVAMSKSSENETNAQNTGSALKSIQQQIVSINSMNTHIASATEEQASVASQVVDNVVNMNASFEQTLQILSQVRNVSEGLVDFADELKNATSQFKL
ncbi:HAMP domain-containing protein [Shewanella baltica]|uniref:methyl-accepting chemotaxis protein n=1 Tax=Shewanella baltica TaxID=62322 RepID=UPI002228B63D|nr:methyl-accepting chemotaxis protein [Shewanella baltica]MCS6126540.1 HAMP domain-containing protein [Shewanella baltica]MCS6137861.1 HAMP domain-containing protein [Shewanella baltica]MCS6144622.1 HAMP domain-containing protein [Shewanella baltica]MCS6169150.1 HAMP domain-containing protein [Shewanella baltica]MCS6186556.1 HAMP domain-containing protein [Shewanella baltica]